MDIYEPVTAHAPLGEDHYCAAHDGFDYRWVLSQEHREALTTLQGLGRSLACNQPRIWQLTETVKTTALLAHQYPLGETHKSVQPFVLWRGTRLRLDWQGGYADGETSDTWWRFCALDGPLAGTCWHAIERNARDDSSHFRDPVEPVVGQPA
jgi:hypothetical protein